MTPERLHRGVAAELDAIASLGIITPEQRARIGERYPTGAWDVRSLTRWLTLLGAVSMAAGAVILGRTLVSYENMLDAGLALGTLGALALGLRLRASHPRTGSALLLGAGLLFQGFTFSFAAHHSSGSGNWPALLGAGDVVLLILAYATRNRLNLVHACVTFFVWFGGSTGYVSGWGMYWLGLTYPLRFLLVGLASLALAAAHQRWLRGELQAFGRVWAHFGLLVSHIALWFLALFGNFGEDVAWHDNDVERLAFSVLWAVVAIACMLVGARLGWRMLRGYGLTFFIIDVYTGYFQFIAVHTGALWFVHLLLVGGSLVGLGVALETLRRRERPREA